MKKPVLLCILDGWGEMNKGDFDAIHQANTPNYDKIISSYPNSRLETFGLSVGLPKGQMGNSEVGHMNIGGGRVVLQNLPKIDKQIESQQIDSNPAIIKTLEKLKESNGALHLMGLCSNGGVHAHMNHIIYLAKFFAKNEVKVHIHAFSDGRDTAPQTGEGFIKELEDEIAEFDNIEISSISGRYFAMDRDKRWERVEKAYKAIAFGDTEKFDCPVEAIKSAYDNGQNDEFITPISKAGYNGMQDGDAILMANFRADRAREILHCFVDPEFKEFDIKSLKFANVAGIVEYSKNLNQYMDVIYPSEDISNTLGEVISNNGMKQLRISETEKYAHITFFFNGGKEEIFEGEERILVPSPNVATYDLKPEMSAEEVTDKLVDAIDSQNFDLIVVNYANPDMVGHTGVMEAAVKAVETVDGCLKRLEESILKNGGTMLITADHGNIELMVDDQGRPHTQHTVGYVPLILVDKEKNHQISEGSLCDIAPTILDLMNINKPEEMNGKSLIG